MELYARTMKHIIASWWGVHHLRSARFLSDRSPVTLAVSIFLDLNEIAIKLVRPVLWHYERVWENATELNTVVNAVKVKDEARSIV